MNVAGHNLEKLSAKRLNKQTNLEIVAQMVGVVHFLVGQVERVDALEVVQTLFHPFEGNVLVQLVFSQELDVKVHRLLMGRHLGVEGADLEERLGGAGVQGVVVLVQHTRQAVQVEHHLAPEGEALDSVTWNFKSKLGMFNLYL